MDGEGEAASGFVTSGLALGLHPRFLAWLAKMTFSPSVPHSQVRGSSISPFTNFLHLFHLPVSPQIPPVVDENFAQIAALRLKFQPRDDGLRVGFWEIQQGRIASAEHRNRLRLRLNQRHPFTTRTVRP